MLTLHLDSDGEEKELNDKELVEEGEEEPIEGEWEEEQENKNCKSNFDRHRVKLPKVKLSIREKNDRAKQIRWDIVSVHTGKPCNNGPAINGHRRRGC